MFLRVKTANSCTKMGEWQHGLFGCFDNCSVCIITYFIPCYTAGKIGEAVGESCLMCGLVQLVPLANIICSAQLRGKVREQKGIEGGFVGDLLSVWCCYCCALTQSANEIGALGGGQAQEMARE